MDVERMAQVFDNLILNSFRYTQPGGDVLLSARSEQEGLLLQVQDFGSGISPDDLPHIFNRFYRGDKARSQNGESGLGLAISRSIVEAQGGKIRAESTLGQGSLFTITLPI
jgi:two-component system, OmpR family, sensor histidine kinase BaeS